MVFKFLLKIIFIVVNSVFSLINSVLADVFLFHALFDAPNMTESSKKRKRSGKGGPNQTVANRGVINANWQSFLSSNLITDMRNEKPEQKNNTNHYKGTFRRTRKKNIITSNGLQNTMEVEPNESTEDTIMQNNHETKPIERKTNQITKFLAMDCEMVGIGYGGKDNMLARVSIVNKFGECVYDKFVKAREEVIDYRTKVSGVRREDLLNAESFITVQQEVADIIRGKILVGHSLHNDLRVLYLSHPKRNIRDTSKYWPFRKIANGGTPSLKLLATQILNIQIQDGEHSSIEDARAAMQVYCTVAKNWETIIAGKRRYEDD